MVYQWKPASYIRADPNAAGAICEELEKTGGLTPKRLLDASRPKDAPLHGEFEWNNQVAAEKYREGQARHIIQCLVVKPEQEGAEPVRAWFPVTEPNSYTNVAVILKRADMKSAMLQRAIRELEAFQKKYTNLKELDELFQAIDRVAGKQRQAAGPAEIYP